MNEDKDELVPLLQVLDDMYSDGYIRYAARDYYKTHYATPEEVKSMEREEKIEFIVAATVLGIIAGACITLAVLRTLNIL